MTSTTLKLALITSGIDHLSSSFHTLPEQPFAIIELGEWDTKQHLRYLARKGLRLLLPTQYPDCEQYCRKHSFVYKRVSRNNKSALKTILGSLNIDLALTYRCPLLPMSAFESVPHGAINLHNSALPDYRGGNPLFWQVINNENEIGCTVHEVSAKMDEGDIIETLRFERPRNVHFEDLNYLANVTYGLPMLRRAIDGIAAGSTKRERQPNHDKLNKAPNCDWRQWRDVAEKRNLSKEHRHDIACFVGESAKPSCPELRI